MTPIDGSDSKLHLASKIAAIPAGRLERVLGGSCELHIKVCLSAVVPTPGYLIRATISRVGLTRTE